MGLLFSAFDLIMLLSLLRKICTTRSRPILVVVVVNRIFAPRVGRAIWTIILHSTLSLALCNNWCSGRPVRDVMSIQAVFGLPRVCEPGVVPWITSFSKQPPDRLRMWPKYESFLSSLWQTDFCLLLLFPKPIHVSFWPSMTSEESASDTSCQMH